MIINGPRPNKSGRTDEEEHRAETVSYDGEQWHIDAIDDGLAHLSREGQTPHIVPAEYLDTVNDDSDGEEDTGGDGQMRLDDFGTCRRLMTDGGHSVEDDEDETTPDFSAGIQVPEEDAESGVPDDYDPDNGDGEDDSSNGTDSTPITGSPEQWRETVPQSMQEIDRWLMWSGEPDTPRRPHWRGDYSVSYNDPDDWHSFEAAVEAAAETDSWGIGFVTGDDISVIDLDGVKGDDGRPVDWAPDLGRLRRAYEGDGGPYVEWSPSETGLHIPVSGMDKPDWWTDLSVDDREHEGVDLLQGQFVTVTGQCERSFDGGVIEHCPEVDLLLQEAQEAITSLNGGTDLVNNGDGGDWTPDDEWLTEDDIREALTHIDADCGYNQWRNIGFAIAEYYHREDGEGKERAKELYKEWSQNADEKWDSQAEKQAERIVEDSWNRIDTYQESDGSSPVTVGTLVAYAQEAGWDMPVPPQAAVADEPDETDWEVIEEERQSVEWGIGSNVLLEARDDVVDWKWRTDEDGEPVEVIGLTVAEPIDAVDDVYCTLDLQTAKREHRVDADMTTSVKMPGRVHRRVVNHEPLHKLAHRLDALYDDCLNAEARSVAVQRLLQALEVITVGGQEDKTLYVYDPGTGIYDDGGREVVRAVVESVCPARASDHEKREIVSKIADRTREPSSDAFEPCGEFDGERHDYRVVGNGILRLPTDEPEGSVCAPELLDYSPDLRARKRVPTDYNPDADTSAVEQWLGGMTGRDEDKQTLEELAGNVLLPNYRHPKITMLHGSGRNGKGVLLDVIAEMCGGVESKNVAGNRLEDLVDNDFRGAKMMEALVNVNGELNGRKLSERDASKLKELTGGEPQEAEDKHISAETFRNNAKLFFASNSPLLPPETKESWQERWVPIELPHSFVPNPDPDNELQKQDDKKIKQKMTREENLEAMLLLAVEGLARLEEQGDVSLPESPEERLEDYALDADPISRVEVELLEAARNPSEKAEKYVPKSAVYEGYKSMARDDGVEPIPDNRFFSILKDRMEELPYHESRPQAPDGVDNNREYSLRGVQFDEDAVEHLSDYWLSHPWVGVSETAGDQYGAGNGDREGIEIADVAGVRPSLLTLTGERVDVVNAGVGEWMPSDTDVHAFGSVGDRYEEAVMDLVAFEPPKNADEIEAGCEVEIRGAVLGEYEGELQLQMDEDTVVHVVETTDDDQETVDDAAEAVNDGDDDSEGENTTPSAPDGSEAAQRGVRADGGGSESDSEAIDNAVLQAAEGSDTVAAVAGRVSGMVETDDLDQIRHRMERLAERGDIILDELTIANDEDEDSEEGSEGTSNHIPVAEALRRVAGRSGLPVGEAVKVLKHDTAVPPGRERDALEVVDGVEVNGERVVVSA